jgi:hypothetical protein
VTLAHNL